MATKTKSGPRIVGSFIKNANGAETNYPYDFPGVEKVQLTYDAFSRRSALRHLRDTGFPIVSPYEVQTEWYIFHKGQSVQQSRGNPTLPWELFSWESSMNTVGRAQNAARSLSDVSLSNYSVARDKAVAQANSNVRDTMVALGEALAEIEQTIGMMADTASRIVKAARYVRRGRFGKAARALGTSVPGTASVSKTFAENWLAYRYGWLPLYGTIYGGLVASYELSIRTPAVLRVQGSATTTSSLSTTYQDDGGSSDGMSMWYLPWTCNTNATSRYRARVSYWIQRDMGLLSKAQNLGLYDPLSLVWELIPFSFVVDWFANIGDIVDEISTFHGASYLVGCISHKVEVEAISVSTPEPRTTSYSIRSGIPASTQLTLSRYRRDVYNVPPSVHPHFNNGLNTTRLLDAVTLIRQLFSDPRDLSHFRI